MKGEKRRDWTTATISADGDSTCSIVAAVSSSSSTTLVRQSLTNITSMKWL